MATPHSRACGIRKHDHGTDCNSNCPTCGGRPFKTDDDLRNFRTIHIDIPIQAPTSEAEAFEEAVAEAVHGFEVRTGWDPMMSSHGGTCDDSDHCHGPVSKVPVSKVPAVGVFCHYTSYGTPGGEYESQCRAAVIAGLTRDEGQDFADLVVFNPTGLFFNSCPQDESLLTPSGDHRGGTWHWPESS